MKELEDWLKELPLSPVPHSLDRSVRDALQTGKRRGPSVASLPVPLWVCASACLVFLGVGVWIPNPFEKSVGTSRPSVVCLLHADSDFKEVFAPEREPSEFFLRRKVIVDKASTTQMKKKG